MKNYLIGPIRDFCPVGYLFKLSHYLFNKVNYLNLTNYSLRQATKKSKKSKKKSKKIEKIERGPPADFRFFNFWFCCIKQLIYKIKFAICSKVTGYLLEKLKSSGLNKVNYLLERVTWVTKKVNNSNIGNSSTKRAIEISSKSTSKISRPRSHA